ncbi:MAG: presenilin family intramembrane aspartyl protease, partial [Nanoarchaeota archaeon]|nr:presenilin family intramembrane aspartyl protease [Nanoarchaeota archaeon]
MKTSIGVMIAIMLIFITVMIGTLLFSKYLLSVLTANNLEYIVEYSPVGQYFYFLYIVTALLLVTWISLILIKHGLTKIIYLFFGFLVVVVLFDFFLYLLPPLINIIATAIISIYYFKFSGTIGKDLVNIILFLTVGSIMALSLGFVLSVVLTAVIAVYDYIAVYKTKHMITLVKGLGNNFYLSGITLLAKKETKRRIMIGGGDLIFPSILFTATFLYFSHIAAYFVLFGALAGISYIFIFG